MNLVLLEEGDFVAGTARARLSGRRFRHVAGVHHARPGDRLRVGVLGGSIGTGVVTGLDETGVELDVALEHDPPAPLPLVLLLALPRPKVLRRVVQAVTAMGVKRLYLISSWRVEKSFWSSPAMAPAALREDMILGLEQSGDTILPRVEIRRRFKPFVEDELPAIAASSRALVAHPPAARECPRGLEGPVTLAVGPEGGFILYEIEKLESCGFEAVSLGTRPLRVEQAVPALLGRLF